MPTNNFQMVAFVILALFAAVGWWLYHRGNNKIVELTMKFMESRSEDRIVNEKLTKAIENLYSMVLRKSESSKDESIRGKGETK